MPSTGVCCEEDQCVTMDVDSESESEEEPCFPFSACSCVTCSSFIIDDHNIPVMEVNGSKYNRSVYPDLVKNTLESVIDVWEPPKLG